MNEKKIKAALDARSEANKRRIVATMSPEERAEMMRLAALARA